MPSTRRAQPDISRKAQGVIYLLHFHERLGTEKHSIQHYLGFTPDLVARLEKHRAGRGARVTQVLRERGIGFDVVAVWPGNRQIENALKLHSATPLCPTCTANPRIPRVVQEAVEAEEKRQAREVRQVERRIREAQRHAEAVAAKRAMSPDERGTDMARRFMQTQVAGGRTPEQIAATHAYVTGPWRESTRSTEAEATLHSYDKLVADALARLRQDQGEAEAEQTAGAAPEADQGRQQAAQMPAEPAQQRDWEAEAE